MISLCNYCDRHTPADGSKWILNDLNKVEYQETSGKAMTWRQWTHMAHLCLQPSLQCRFWHVAAPDVCGGRPQLAKANTAFQAHPLVNRLNLA